MARRRRGRPRPVPPAHGRGGKRDTEAKEFLKVAAALGLRDALIVIEGEPENLALGIRNLKAFKTLPAKALNVYDILSYDQLVFTGAALKKITEVLAK